MDEVPNHSKKSLSLQETFMGSLLTDVASVMERQASRDNQSTRRELVRTLFAAVEGLVWTYREHILEIGRATDMLTPAEEYAFSEKSYLVSDQGKIVEQTRFMPIPALIRLTTRLAGKISPALEIKFDNAGWHQFQQALKIRNRVTHPKSETDLLIDSKDLGVCFAAFDWLFELCLTAMEAATVVHKQNLALFRTMLEKLKRGDPDALAAYNTAVAMDTDDSV